MRVAFPRPGRYRSSTRRPSIAPTTRSSSRLIDRADALLAAVSCMRTRPMSTKIYGCCTHRLNPPDISIAPRNRTYLLNVDTAGFWGLPDVARPYTMRDPQRLHALFRVLPSHVRNARIASTPQPRPYYRGHSRGSTGEGVFAHVSSDVTHQRFRQHGDREQANEAPP